MGSLCRRGAGYVNSQYANSDAQSKRDAPEFGYSGQLGGRYLLKDHWGVYAEAGYGGVFVQIGISFKLLIIKYLKFI